MPNFKITLSYDGTGYAGWQLQPDQSTVQGEIERAICKVTGQGSRVIASGRTDAGVHAIGQVASVCVETKLTPNELRRALNAVTPEDIFIRFVVVERDKFHPIRDARKKRYRYIIQDGREIDVFQRAYAWHVKECLDEQAMRSAARVLVGRHDFASFQASGAVRVSTTRTISDLQIVRRRTNQSRDQISIEIEADGFLYMMVRIIVGTLVEIGRGHRSVGSIRQVLLARDRTKAGVTAPPQGLFLVSVDYRDQISATSDGSSRA